MRYAALLFAFLLLGCEEEVAVAPDPAVLTADAVGHYCRMIVVDHHGPKGQVHLAGQTVPLWFTQVRDTIAYMKSEEREGAIRAVYVSDMGRASDWKDPGAGNWIDAREASFVLGSDAVGGMGAPELVPFAEASAAKDFAAARGGRVVDFAAIPTDAVFSPVDTAPAATAGHGGHTMPQAGDHAKQDGHHGQHGQHGQGG